MVTTTTATHTTGEGGIHGQKAMPIMADQMDTTMDTIRTINTAKDKVAHGIAST